MHSCNKAMKVRDGCRLEHQVIGASLAAKGFGEHLGKKGWKARVVDDIGAGVIRGSFGAASHDWGATS